MRIFHTFLLLVIIIGFSSALAWDDADNSTHELITIEAIDNSKFKDYLSKNLDVSYTVSNINGKPFDVWLRGGSKEEDSPMCRASNHFHDPLRPWDESGLTTLGVVTAICSSGAYGGYDYPPEAIKSNIFWATEYLQLAPDGDKESNLNDWDWRASREHFYTYLTGKDYLGQRVAVTLQEKEQYFGKSLQALGQVLHLLQDMSVPAHTRDDFQRVILYGHTQYNGWGDPGTKDGFGEELEVFVATYSDNNPDWFNASNVIPDSAFSVTDFWDQNIYTGTNPESTWSDPVGLSEFANANFITEASVNDYPHPNVNAVPWDMVETFVAEDGKPDNRVYLTQTGPLSYRIASPGYLTSDCEANAVGQLDLRNETLIIDEAVKSDYARILIPRAISYSSALIDYFFRGSLKITAPDHAVYSITDGATIDPEINAQTFDSISLNVQNDTPGKEDTEGNVLSYEPMENGNLIAVAKYKKRSDYLPNLSGDPPSADSRESGFSYSVSQPIAIQSLSSDEAEQFDFDFSSDPIPANITDLYLQVVFKGTLGKEKDTAIAVGLKDLNEPQHICIC